MKTISQLKQKRDRLSNLKSASILIYSFIPKERKTEFPNYALMGFCMIIGVVIAPVALPIYFYAKAKEKKINIQIENLLEFKQEDEELKPKKVIEVDPSDIEVLVLETEKDKVIDTHSKLNNKKAKKQNKEDELSL